MKANYFWGIITYSGERERFYNGRLFTIVQPKPLYIYKIDTKNNSLNYFFSETLTGKIISLNKNNINNCTADSITKANLNEFLLANNYNINHAAEYTAVSETTIPVSDGNYTSPVKMSPIVAGFYILYEVTKAFKHEHNTKKQ